MTRFLTQFMLAGALTIAGIGNAGAAGYDAMKEASQDFKVLCAGCHGENATGGGPAAASLPKAPPDLTRIRQRAGGTFDQKAIFDWIIGLSMTSSHGTRDMPVWGDQLLDETLKGGDTLEDARRAEAQVSRRVMGIVKYLETLQTGD